MNFRKDIRTFFLLPYLAILLLALVPRLQTSNLALLDGDSGNYLIPPYLKIATDEWHKGERPLPYLLFIYGTMGHNYSLSQSIFIQKVICAASAVCLVFFWLLLLSYFRITGFWGHLLGYLFLYLYISCYQLWYYNQFIGPESLSISAMVFLLLGIAYLFAKRRYPSMFYFTILIIVACTNLYLSSLLTKWIFAAFALDLLLLYNFVWRNNAISIIQKVSITLVPHIFYLLLVVMPESKYQVDSPFENRSYISIKQMVFTHFDLLAKDKNNFNLTPALNDSLMSYYDLSKKVEPGFLIGFSSDYLMWGEADNLIAEHFSSDYHKLYSYFASLNYTLATKYPLQLIRSITIQLYAFFVPNHYVTKGLGTTLHLEPTYAGTVFMVNRFDKDFAYKLRKNNLPDPNLSLARLYPENIFMTRLTEIAPFVSKQTLLHSFYYYFDWLFFLSCALYIVVKSLSSDRFVLCPLLVILLLLLIYACTVGTVHTFDITRFSFTVFPLLIAFPFMLALFVLKRIFALFP